MKKKNLFGLVFLSLILMSFSISCDENATVMNVPVRTVNVTGKAVIFAEPDKVTISFSLNSRNKDLKLAKEKNNKTIKALNEVLKKFDIEKKYISIQNIEIRPRYSYRYDEPKFMHYEINQSISVSLVNLQNYEAFLSEILELGVDNINNIYFSVEDLKKFKNEARIKAVKNAEEKAKLLCSASENNGKKLKLGRVLQISENSKQNSFSRGLMSKQNVEYENMRSDSAGVESFSVSGKIQISAEVDMVFELKK